MPTLIKIQDKGQVTIPNRIRSQAGLMKGDLVEAAFERGRIVLTPKSVVDRAIAEGLADIRAGRVSGPFETVDEMLASLKGKRPARKSRAKRR